MDHREYRRALRLEVSGEVTTRLLDLAGAVELRDVGPGGFLIWSPVDIPPGTEHSVQFTAGDGWTTTLKARSVHGRRLGGRGPTTIHAVGFAFVFPPGEHAEAAVAQLIDKITAVLSFH